MDTDRLNRWLALGANFGVLIGIILLIIELDQNREMVRAQTRNEISQGELIVLGSIAGDKELTDLLVRVSQGEGLTPGEKLRHLTHSESVFRLWQNMHYQGRHGLYEEGEFQKHIETMGWVLNQGPYLIVYWCQARTIYPKEFAAEVDGLIPPDSCIN